MAPNACTYCNKPSTATKPLKPCNNCKVVAYCDRKCQQAHFKAHKKTCREQKIAEDHAARDEQANEKAAKDAYAYQLATEFIVSAPTDAEQQPRVMCWVEGNGAAVSRTLDGKQHVQAAHTYVLRSLPAAAQGEQAITEYREFTSAMIGAMEHMTEGEKAAYHSRIQTAVFKQWDELYKDPDGLDERDEEERKEIDRAAKRFMREDRTKCLNQRS